MQTLTGIAQAMFMLFLARWGYTYYTGKIGLSGQAEERRKRSVKKIGWLIIFFSIGLFLIGVVMFIFNVYGLLLVLVGKGDMVFPK